MFLSSKIRFLSKNKEAQKNFGGKEKLCTLQPPQARSAGRHRIESSAQKSSMADTEPLLRSLGVLSETPFDWGDEPQAKQYPVPTALPSTVSGLDSLKQYVQDRDVTDDPVKRAITSLLVKAHVPLTTEHSSDKSSHRKRYVDLLEGDGDLASRDVSIRGLSDRACAELTVESKSSLFGSILRIFDMSKEDKIFEKEMVAKAAAGSGAPDAKSTEQTSSSQNKPSVGTEGATSKIMEEAKAFVTDISASMSDSTKIIDTQQNSATDKPKQTGGAPTAAKAQSNSTTKSDAPSVPVVSPEIIARAKDNPLVADAPVLCTAEIVRSCHLTASPGDIPPCMDSKEYTMAALHFLSSNIPMISEKDVDLNKDKSQSMHSWKVVRDTFPILPLLVAINPEESLEKRVYGRIKPLIELGKSERKQQPDSVDLDAEFRRKVLNLERAFTSSLPFTSKTLNPSAIDDLPMAFQRYVPRRKLCPRIETEGVKEELTLMISGHVQQASQSQAAATKSKSII